MAAGNWELTNATITNIVNGTFAIGSDTFKVALFQSTSNLGAGSTSYSGVSNEVANGNGYTTGGVAVTLTLSGTTTVKVDFQTDPEWTGSGSGFSARWAALYEVSGNVLAYCLLDSSPADVTVAAGQKLTVAANANGVMTITKAT
jgi:hypothetical protein